MSKIRLTYDHIIKYLKGLLSNRERHDFERKLDAFDQEAMEGLSQLTAGELEADLELLNNRIDQRAKKGRTVRLFPWWRVAAAAVIITGTLLFIVLNSPNKEMITENVTPEKNPAPGKSAPSPTQTPAANEIKQAGTDTQISDRVKSFAENDVPALAGQPETSDAAPGTLTSIEKKDETNLQLTSAAETYQDQEMPIPDSLSFSGYITGRVLGINRKALPGVSITEEGSSKGTVTDLNGNFKLKVSDPRSRLELSYAGYENKELPSHEIAGKEITLDEVNVPENNLVVLNYPAKSAARSAAPASKEAPSGDFTRPLPPGGSMKNFDTWVESRIDTLILKELLPGNYKISVRLKVYKDGKIGDLNVNEDVPEVAAAEYKRVISQSERWQPAMNGNLPVDSDILIEFSLIVK